MTAPSNGLKTTPGVTIVATGLIHLGTARESLALLAMARAGVIAGGGALSIDRLLVH